MQGEDQFVASKVFPNVPVAKQADKYYVYTRDSWLRPEAKKRAPGTQSAGSGWELSSDTYFADVWAIHKDNSDQDYANADQMFNLDQEATEWCSLQMRLRQEAEFIATYMSAGVWTADQTGVASSPGANEFLQWDLDDSTPIGDIKAQIIAATKRTGGFRPNTLVLGPELYDVLTEHTSILSRIQYSERAIVSTDLLASLFGLAKVMVPYPVINEAAEGAAIDIEFSYGKSALLAYAAPNPGLRTPSAGYTFSWTGYIGASPMGTRIKRFRMEEIASWRIEGESAFDMKVVDPAAGVFFADAIS
jgi:hypothetical protein